MPSMVVLLLSAALAHAPTPERTVLWNDPAATSFEQTLVRHMLMQTLATDASTPVWSNVRLAAHERRAMRLRRRAVRHLTHAYHLMDTLSVDAAMVEAAQARQKLTRVALLSGDTLPLCESLTLLSAALLLQGATRAGQQVLEELLVLEPAFDPSPALFNPAMLERVQRTRARLARAPRRPLDVRVAKAGAALFVDGAFVGFERAHLDVIAHVPHLVWALGADGQHTAMRLQPDAEPDGEGAVVVTLALDAPAPAPELAPQRLEPALEASRSPTLGIQLHSPALRAMRVNRVLVLAYGHGELTLTHLRLHPIERRRVRAPALLTDLREADRIAKQLLAEPPALVPLPVPPRSLPANSSNARL